MRIQFLIIAVVLIMHFLTNLFTSYFFCFTIPLADLLVIYIFLHMVEKEVKSR